MTISQAIKITKENIEDCLEEDRDYYKTVLHLLTNPPVRKSKISTINKIKITNLQKSLQYHIENLEQLKKVL